MIRSRAATLEGCGRRLPEGTGVTVAVVKGKDGAAGSGIYLDCAMVQPADILLTTQRHPVSAAIRTATRGPFSHAALIIERTALLEADGDGTGYTTLLYDRVEQLYDPPRGRFLHELPAHTTCAKLLRRPGLANDPAGLFKTLQALARPFLWKEYPELCATAAVFNKELPKKKAFLPFLRVLDKYAKQRPTNPGAFCSQLVAAIYEALGSPLIPGVPPEEVSPNAIAKAPGLMEMTEAITVPDESAELNDDVRALANAVMQLQFSRSVLPGLVEFKATVDRLDRDARTNEDE